MNEHFLHFVWKNGLFDKSSLKTSCNSSVEIIDPGLYNRNSGPDFLNARIVIGETEWAGNVEIHYRASSWFKHKHHNDNAYNNVILHIVVIDDMEAVSASGSAIATIEIKVDSNVVKCYKRYMSDESLIACRKDLNMIDRFSIRHWIFQMAVERLKRKTERIKLLLQQTLNDWEEVLYRLIASNIGLNVNRQAFELLAAKTPLKIIRKHSDNILQVEALLYGQAGFLEPGLFDMEPGDLYFNELKKEFTVLKSLYQLKPMDSWLWKFHRMRPVNFPTRRISQLAFLMTKHDGLFRKIIDSPDQKLIIDLLYAEASAYWKNHYRFGKKTGPIPVSSGRKLRDTLLINVIVPLLWSYGNIQKRNELCDRAIDLADSISPENNRISRQWTNAGVEAASAFESQGLIELTEQYCKNRKCLNCHIGTKLISLGKEFDPGSKLILGEPF